MANEMTSFGTLSLGALIDLLEKRDPEQSVMFDFGALIPSMIASYRGFYDHLALGWDGAVRFDNVGELLEALRASVGDTYTGWKGGEYRMTRETPIWAARPGETGSTAIVGLCDCDYTTIVKTQWVPV